MRTAKYGSLILALTSCVWLGAAHAESAARWGMGLKLHGSTWAGENDDGTEFEASGGMLGLGVKVQGERVFGGLSVVGGEFEFEDDAPERPTKAMAPAPERIKQREADLIVGYYFWQKVALFLDLKTVTHHWVRDAYEVNYGGLGFGVSAHHGFAEGWSVYGTFGLVPMSIKVDDEDVGDAGRSALEFGVLYAPNPNVNLGIGLKSQGHRDEYDNGQEQEHRRGDLALGLNVMF